jgi:uncharacterized membrane protein
VTSSLLLWEILTFVVLMAVFLPFLPRITRSISGDRDASRKLDGRYADGETTREEYLTIRDDITRNPDA